jgi:hypothetical protein
MKLSSPLWPELLLQDKQLIHSGYFAGAQPVFSPHSSAPVMIPIGLNAGNTFPSEQLYP